MASLKLRGPHGRAVILNALAAVGYVLAITRANAGNDSLIDAAMREDLTRVRLLLHAKAGLNERDSDGKTALIIASQEGHAAVVRALLAAGANVNARVDNGATALNAASQHGHGDVVRLPKNAGADR